MQVILVTRPTHSFVRRAERHAVRLGVGRQFAPAGEGLASDVKKRPRASPLVRVDDARLPGCLGAAASGLVVAPHVDEHTAAGFAVGVAENGHQAPP